VYPEWLTFKPEDTEARRRAVTDVARRRGRIAATAQTVKNPPAQQQAPAAVAAGPPALLGFREWAERNAPDLIGRRFVPRARLQAAKDAYARYVAVEKERQSQRVEAAEAAETLRRTKVSEDLAERAAVVAEGHLTERRGQRRDRVRRDMAPPTPEEALNQAAAQAASQAHPQDPLAARRAYRAPGKSAPTARDAMDEAAAQAATRAHPQDPLAARRAYRGTGAGKGGEPLVSTSSIGERLAGDPGASLTGFLEQITADPIGGWLELKAWSDEQGSAWTSEQREQVGAVLDAHRPTLAQINEAWEGGYFLVEGALGIDDEAASRSRYVAAIKAILKPEELQRLQHLGRSRAAEQEP
jgi:hypothetical protein